MCCRHIMGGTFTKPVWISADDELPSNLEPDNAEPIKDSVQLRISPMIIDFGGLSGRLNYKSQFPILNAYAERHASLLSPLHPAFRCLCFPNGNKSPWPSAAAHLGDQWALGLLSA